MNDHATIQLNQRPEPPEDALCIAVATALGAANFEFDSIRVASRSGWIVLSGSLHRYYLKQLAQTIARTVNGVSLLRNEILVSETQLR
jgi:osmotically-inducible protein OsmY